MKYTVILSLQALVILYIFLNVFIRVFIYLLTKNVDIALSLENDDYTKSRSVTKLQSLFIFMLTWVRRLVIIFSVTLIVFYFIQYITYKPGGM